MLKYIKDNKIVCVTLRVLINEDKGTSFKEKNVSVIEFSNYTCPLFNQNIHKIPLKVSYIHMTRRSVADV